MSLIIVTSCLVALASPLTTRRHAVIGAAAALGGTLQSGASANAVEPPYRVAMSVLIDPVAKTRGELIVEVVPAAPRPGASRRSCCLPREGQLAPRGPNPGKLTHFTARFC